LLHQETHKFEAQYDTSLVGPYPERRDLFHQRSPIHFIDRVHAALLLLQGSDDPIVPPNQAQLMFDALRAAGTPCACIMFAGEQHGFRQADTIKRALDAELSFYSQVLGIDIADELEPVEIANLGKRA
jgi:dipeptidyl aminopeptidase/acylaminoacyl peptidase